MEHRFSYHIRTSHSLTLYTRHFFKKFALARVQCSPTHTLCISNYEKQKNLFLLIQEVPD